MVYSFIWILTYSPTWHIPIINCWKKKRTHSLHNLCIRKTLPLDYLFFLTDTCCKNLLYPLFSLFPHQNKTLLILVYIYPLTHVSSYYDFIRDISLSTKKKKKMSNPTFEPTHKIYFFPECGLPKTKNSKLPCGRQASDQCSECNRRGFAWRPASAILEKFAS